MCSYMSAPLAHLIDTKSYALLVQPNICYKSPLELSKVFGMLCTPDRLAYYSLGALYALMSLA